MMEGMTSLEHVDRLHIIVSSAEEEQLLGVPKLLKQRLSWTVWKTEILLAVCSHCPLTPLHPILVEKEGPVPCLKL